MIFSLWRQYGALNSKAVWDAFEKSIVNSGHQVTYNNSNADIDVIWSVLWSGRMTKNKEIWKNAIKNNRPIIVIEVGGIKRGVTWRIGLNGINRDAYFCPLGNDNSRAKKLQLKLKPWRKNGEYILICGQHERSQQWDNLPPMREWVEQQITILRKYTDRQIIFRPHPRSPVKELGRNFASVLIQKPLKCKGTYDDFNINFNDAWAVVSLSSNPGPASIINGVPAFVGTSSLAYAVGNTDYSLIEAPQMPDRSQWLNDYAHTEYTLDEIEEGIPLKYLTKKLR
jgi:hypothetical protein